MSETGYRSPEDHLEEEYREHHEYEDEAVEAVVVAGTAGEFDVVEEGAGLFKDAWKDIRKRKLFWVAAVLIGIFTLMAIVPQLFVAPSPATHNPRDCSLRNRETGEFQDLLTPSSEHWFGTDIQGCDYYARVIYGAKVSIIIGIGGTLILLIIGIVLGGIAGFYGGAADALIGRFVDILFAFPFLIAAFLFMDLIAGESSRNEWHVLVFIGMFGWAILSRIFRGAVLQAKEKEYVESAVALGASRLRILFRHIFPNAFAPAFVYAMIGIGGIIGAEAALSFLGIGLELPAISWGLMINNAQDRIIDTPHLLMFPGLFLSLTVLGFLLLGDVVRDALDPRMR
ncbi:MAG TPA: ABC transporter permease [Acidimicrobiia bacterium]|nr:ABC transporter permease [Acidimicrobiia bacterium]